MKPEDVGLLFKRLWKSNRETVKESKICLVNQLKLIYVINDKLIFIVSIVSKQGFRQP